MKSTKDQFSAICKTSIYAIVGLILVVIFLFILSYFQYYVHEFGHANVAVLSTFTQKNPSLTINFTYVDFPLMNSLKVPQQTGATILTSYTILFNLAGIFATIIFYAVIFLLVARIKIIRNSKVLEIPLIMSFLILIFQDIAFNLVCGTDGLKLSCNDFITNLMFLTFNGLLFISLGFFFAMLVILLKRKGLPVGSP